MLYYMRIFSDASFRDEYGRLFEFVKSKHLRVKNIGNKVCLISSCLSHNSFMCSCQYGMFFSAFIPVSWLIDLLIVHIPIFLLQ